jgi:hypothetical protein
MPHAATVGKRGSSDAYEMEQIVGITAQCGIGHAADALLVQETVHPSYFPTRLIGHTKGTLRIV